MIRVKAATLILLAPMITMPVRADVTVDGKPVENMATDNLLIRQDDCRALTVHHPREDVTYLPGRDSVPPADLEPSLDLSDRARNFALVVTVDLDDRLGTGSEGQKRPFSGEGYIGYIEVRDGRAYWEGQPLDGDGMAAVSEACRKARSLKDEKDR